MGMDITCKRNVQDRHYKQEECTGQTLQVKELYGVLTLQVKGVYRGQTLQVSEMYRGHLIARLRSH